MKQGLLAAGLFITLIFTVIHGIDKNQPELENGTGKKVRLLSTFPLENRSIELFRKKWDMYKPVYKGNPYLVKPGVKSPYSAGKLEPEFLKDGLNSFKFFRWMLGFSEDVVLDDQYNTWCMKGCVLMYAKKTLGHYVDRPEDMSTNFWHEAISGLKGANLLAAGDSNFNLHDAMRSWLDDTSERNIMGLGHRVALMSPYIKKIGFGKYWRFGAIYVSDYTSRDDEVLWPRKVHYIGWPCAGYFPVEYFNKNQGWLIKMNGYLDTIDDADAYYRITLRSLQDGRSWEFTTNTPVYKKNESYFYKGRRTIVFRPGSNFTCKAGEEYEVTFSDIRLTNGEKALIRYPVRFFSLKK